MAWKSLADLAVADASAPVALLGAPVEKGSVTPGRCDLAPDAVRRAMRRTSTYDIDIGLDIAVSIFDLGDLAVAGVMPGEAFDSICNAVKASVARHDLTVLLGGNNAVTRPAAHGLGLPLERVGLVTLDAHFDLRETDDGPRNGNPVRCLLEDGLPGRNICQVGLASFANTAAMHEDARGAGIMVHTIGACRARGIDAVLDEGLASLAHCDRLMVDFDIDVIDRAQCPGAPGARPGGMPAAMFFAAARRLGAEPRVRLVDLTELDPALDVSDISALTAARWLAELLAGYAGRAA